VTTAAAATTATGTGTTTATTGMPVSQSTTTADTTRGNTTTTNNINNINSNNMTFVPQSTFEIFVAKDTFKFNAAHFVAFPGFRERLHGHNYTVSVRLQGSQRYIGPDGYVLDFGNIKKVCKEVCKELNEYFLCPMYSDVLHVTYLTNDDNNTNHNTRNNNNSNNKKDESNHRNHMIRLDCSVDDTYFLMPRNDVKLLPIVHATAEELSIYLWSCVMERLDASFLQARGIQFMELTVAEAPGQQASFRYPVQGQTLDVRSFIQSGLPLAPSPKPCLPTNTLAAASTKTKTSTTTRASSSSSSLQIKPTVESFMSLTTAMKAHGLLTREVSADEMSRILKTLEK
jgi:6-pyruvoyltetrahydropterin/6-carboxytetrahydropterin synthase